MNSDTMNTSYALIKELTAAYLPLENALRRQYSERF
jgi:hypothetical protein